MRIELRWALIFAAMMIGWMTIEKLTGLHGPRIEQHAVYTNFVAIPAILLYVFALIDKRQKDYGGYMTYAQGLRSGLVITFLYAPMSVGVVFLSTQVISPEFFPNVIALVIKTNVMKPDEAAAYFNLNNYMISAFLGSLIMGAITSVLVALFVRRAPSGSLAPSHQAND